jgi:hypothetical protein
MLAAVVAVGFALLAPGWRPLAKVNLDTDVGYRELPAWLARGPDAGGGRHGPGGARRAVAPRGRSPNRPEGSTLVGHASLAC